MRNHRGNMLLIELSVVLLFFAMSLAIVLQVFAKAQLKNRDAEVLNYALLRAEDAAETLAVAPSAEQALLALGFFMKDGGFESPVQDGSHLTATLTRLTQPTGVLTSVELTAWQGDKMLFTIPAMRYQGGDGT